MQPSLPALISLTTALAAILILYFSDSHLNILQLDFPPRPTTTTPPPMLSSTAKSAMSRALAAHAMIRPHRSASRSHSDHGWLDTYHSFSFADWHDPAYMGFGALRVLNEDRVAAQSGFPTHPHRDYEIFSYVISGELTHRDSMLQKGAEGGPSDKFYRMHRGDVQFTTGGKGIAHSEFNEHPEDTVHFLQIWVKPWRAGLEPRYHTRHFGDAAKREGFVPVISRLGAGPRASEEEEVAAEPAIPGTIPIHADFVMGAGLLAPGKTFEWEIGGGTEGVAGTESESRKVYVHLAMTTSAGTARIRLQGREDAVLGEGDGAYVDGVARGDRLSVESVGDGEAEVIVLDSA